MGNKIYNFGIELHEMNANLLLEQATWPALVELLRNDIRFVQDKNQVSGIVGCAMSAPYRNNENVIAREFFYLDVDSGASVQEVKELMKPYEYLMYATYSHNPEQGKDKFRVLLPLANAMSFEEWQMRRATFKKAFPFADPASFVCSQFMKAPVLSPVNQQHFFFEVNHGELFDAFQYEAHKAQYTKQPEIEFDQSELSEVKQAILQGYNAFNSHNIRFNMCCTMKHLGIDSDFVANVLVMSGSDHDKQYWVSTYNQAKTLYAQVRKLYKLIGYNTKASISQNALAAAQRLKAEGISAPAVESKYSQKFLLTQDQYLGDVLDDIDFGYMNLLIADCGVGKNYTTSRQPKAWVVSPLRLIVQQNANSANQQSDEVQAFIDEVQENEVSVDQHRVLCTWNKLATVYRQYLDGDDVSALKDITLFIDESHGMYLDVYKQDVINVIYDIVDARLFKRVVFMSGTSNADDYHIKFDKVIRVQKQSAPKYTYKVVTNDVYSYIAHSVLNSTADGIVVLWNNKNQIDKLQVLLEGEKNLLCVTAEPEVKNSPDVQRLRFEEVLPSQYDGVIGTYSIVEGMNIKNSVDTVDVFVAGNETIERVEQLSNRYRAAKNVNVYHVVPKSEPDLEYSILFRKDVNAEANKIASALNIVLDSLACTPEARMMNAKRQMHTLKDFNDPEKKYSLLRLHTDSENVFKFATNTVGIDWMVSNSKARYDSFNFSSYKERLSRLNHFVHLVFCDMVDIGKEARKAIEDAAEELKGERKAQAIKNVIEYIQLDTVDAAFEEMTKKREESPERNLLVEVMRVRNYIAAEDIIDMLVNDKLKAVYTDIDRVKNANKIVSYINSNMKVGDVLTPDAKIQHAQCIMDLWKNDKTLQAADVDLNKKAKYENGALTVNSATAILKRYISTGARKNIRVPNSTKTVSANEVQALNLSGYAITKQATTEDRKVQEAVQEKQTKVQQQAAMGLGMELMLNRRAAIK